MKKSSAWLLVILLFSLSLLSGCGGAKPSSENKTDGKQPAAETSAKGLERVKKAGKLRFAVDVTYPPMEFEGTNGESIGYDVDFAKELAKRLGVEAEPVVMKWDGILAGLTSGRYDVIISSMTITDERKQEVDFVEYAQVGQVFVSKTSGLQDRAGPGR